MTRAPISPSLKRINNENLTISVPNQTNRHMIMWRYIIAIGNGSGSLYLPFRFSFHLAPSTSSTSFSFYVTPLGFRYQRELLFYKYVTPLGLKKITTYNTVIPITSANFYLPPLHQTSSNSNRTQTTQIFQMNTDNETIPANFYIPSSSSSPPRNPRTHKSREANIYNP